MAKTPTVKEMQAALAGRPYKDAPTQTIDDWKWHPMEHIKAQLAERRELRHQVSDRRLMHLATLGGVQVLLAHRRAKPLGESAFRPHLAAGVGQLHAGLGGGAMRQTTAPDA